MSDARHKINGGGDMLRMVADYLDATDAALRYLAEYLQAIPDESNLSEGAKEYFLRLACIARGEEAPPPVKPDGN